MRELAAALPAAFIPFGGSPLPFPRGAWEGWWARPRVYDPQPPIRELIQLMASFSQLQLLSSLSSLGRCILIFREARLFLYEVPSG